MGVSAVTVYKLLAVWEHAGELAFSEHLTLGKDPQGACERFIAASREAVSLDTLEISVSPQLRHVECIAALNIGYEIPKVDTDGASSSS